MGRWRPPAAASSAYITAQGHARLKDELDHLWRVRRPEVTAAVSAAAAEGDRSENAEYIYRKKELREIDWRVRYLRKRLDVLKVVDAKPADTSKVYFGAVVTLADEDDAEVTYRIVGPDETDAPKGWISMDSPMGKALLGKTVGDVFVVTLPKGEKEWEILGVSYS